MTIVSVVLPNLNMGPYIGQALDSVMAQTLDYSQFEVLVIDGGSTDGSVQIIDSYGPPVRRIDFRGGFQSSINKGFDEARGEYIARLDADDVCHPMRFEKQVNALDSDPDAALCWTDAWRMNKSGMTTGAIWGCNYLTSEQLVSGQVFDALLARNFIPHGTVMIRRSSLGAQRMNESIRHMEDWDLWLRLSLHNKFLHIDEPLYGYRTHQGGSQGFRNIKNLILWRSMKGPRIWLDSLPLTAKQRGKLALTMATSPILMVGSGLVGNRRPDTMRRKSR